MTPLCLACTAFGQAGPLQQLMQSAEDRLFKHHGRWKSETAKDGYVKDSVERHLEVISNWAFKHLSGCAFKHLSGCACLVAACTMKLNQYFILVIWGEGRCYTLGMWEGDIHF